MSEKYLQNDHWCAILIVQKIVNGVTTKYVYGLGLIGEEKCGDFKTYHFDYRGSTAAITDSCGNVTDTFEYDTYGNLTGRTGNSFVIFGYNGRDGVVTDKNGLIYMRARYYDPLMHRFINADVVPGEISDAVTLNRYAYANGNPVSNTDPFGLSAEERGGNRFGSIIYDGNEYEIVVPDHRNTTNTIDAPWKTIYEYTEKDFSFDKYKFIAGIAFDDMNGIANGTNPAQVSNGQQITAGLAGIFNGILTSLASNMSSKFITFVFQESGDRRRVIIKAGSTQVEQIYDRYANGVPNSAYFANAGSPLALGIVSAYAENLYKEKTDNSTKWYHTYDLEITLDKRHKGSKYSSYLWIDSNGTVMETPILYSNDKITVGRRTGLFKFGFKPLLDLNIDTSNPVSEDYQKLFNKAF